MPYKPYSGLAYKYRSFKDFDTKFKAEIEEMFSKKFLYFANASTFNDPFECNPAIKYSPEKLRKYIEKLGKKKGIKNTSKEISNLMQKHTSDDGDFKLNYKKSMSNGIGICCMSKKPCIVTQWAYYSNNGQGFCIEYDLEKLTNTSCIEVLYSKQRPTLDIVDFQENVNYQSDRLSEILSCKAPSWSHEQEVRLFSKTIGLKEIPENCIKGVILGFSIKYEHAEWLIEILKKNTPSIEIKKATLCKKEFDLKIENYI